jgi:hypothetical protein
VLEYFAVFVSDSQFHCLKILLYCFMVT